MIFDFVVGIFIAYIWIEYDGSLVEDTAKWLKQTLTRKL